MRDRYKDRQEAGAELAAELAGYEGTNAIVLALPRGGVPVAAEIAGRLKLCLNVIICHKLGAPGNPEAAIGAVAEDGSLYRDPFIAFYHLPERYLEQEISYQRGEIERRISLYRQGHPFTELPIAGRKVIVVDDGIATGDTLQAALLAVKARHPEEIVVAVPVAPPDVVIHLRRQGYKVICPLQPESLRAVGLWFRDFTPVSDTEVLRVLEQFTVSGLT